MHLGHIIDDKRERNENFVTIMKSPIFMLVKLFASLN